jgi:hypothetical protein
MGVEQQKQRGKQKQTETLVQHYGDHRTLPRPDRARDQQQFQRKREGKATGKRQADTD